MRLIDADALLKAIIEYPYGIRGMIESEIAIQKTVDVVPVRHGRWITHNGLSVTWRHECDQCGHLNWGGSKYPYCPNCGARMDADETD